MKHYTDGKGKWVGHVDERAGMTTYTDAKGQTIARVMDGKTFDAKGKFSGNGDQGAKFFSKKNY